MSLEDQVADHENRIQSLEGDDAAVKEVVHSPLARKAWGFISNPTVTHLLAAIAMASLMWIGAKVGVVVPPASPANVAAEEKKKESPPAAAEKKEPAAPQLPSIGHEAAALPVIREAGK